MKIKYAGTSRGRKLYSVSDSEDRFFTGTLDEVKRFVLMHNAKVQERRQQVAEQVAALRGEVPTEFARG